jgi:anti-anti-sigma factor
MAAHPVISLADVRLEPKGRIFEITVRARGRLTAATSAALERTVRDLTPQFKRIVLDFSKVTHIDGPGLAILVNVYLQARRANCDLEIANSIPSLKQRLRNWLKSVFEGHEEFLGLTPD